MAQMLVFGDLSMVLTFIICNSILQIGIWAYKRKNKWGLGRELMINQYFFWTVLFSTELVNTILTWASQGGIWTRLLMYCLGSFLPGMLSSYLIWFYVEGICADEPYISNPRGPNQPTWTDIAIKQVKYAAIDGVSLWLMSFMAFESLHKLQGEGVEFLSFSASVLVAFPVDITFYIIHRYLLHGALWKWHKAHHSHFATTVMSGRMFDIEDWFAEFTLASIWVAIPVLASIPSLGWSQYLLAYNMSTNHFFSTLHHCGKTEIPCPFGGLIPWSEMVGYPFGTELVTIHEGHHNYVNDNFGLFGLTDRIMGTYRHPKTDADRAKKKTKKEAVLTAKKVS